MIFKKARFYHKQQMAISMDKNKTYSIIQNVNKINIHFRFISFLLWLFNRLDIRNILIHVLLWTTISSGEISLSYNVLSDVPILSYNYLYATSIPMHEINWLQTLKIIVTQIALLIVVRFFVVGGNSLIFKVNQCILMEILTLLLLLLARSKFR